MSLDLLAFGPHPDDVEIGMAGAIVLHVAMGCRVGICDLTRGEMGSNGTPEQRLAEAEAARVELGAALRINLGLPDGGLRPDDHAQLRAVAECIRAHRPRAIAIPFWRDRHPDHGLASRLVARGAFFGALRRFAADGAPWRPDWSSYYFINDDAAPSFVVDVSSVYDVKRRALACHRSQFAPASDDAMQTRLTSPVFAQLVESRDARFGALAGVRFAEGFVVREPVVRPHLLKTWSVETAPAGQALPDRP